MSFFDVQALSAGYTRHPILHDCSFSLAKGSITGILGANGSGKTTLLRAICGILPHSGTCMLDGAVLERLSERQMARLCGYIPQRSGIGIDLPVIDVVLMGFHARLGFLAQPDASMRHTASEALRTVGLGGMEEVNYQRLSEGQKQLCIFARTLVADAKLFLLDEPESALDYGHRYRMLGLLRQRIAASDGCALAALHDPVLALNCCDRLLFLADGTVQGVVSPHDEPGEAVQMLRRICGPVSIRQTVSDSGQKQWVMLREDTEEAIL